MRTLRYGSLGDDVRELQRRLAIPVDGSFGPKTERAVSEYQTAHDLIADGIVGPATWEALGETLVPSEDWRDVPRLGWRTTPCDVYGDSYTTVTLRDDVSEALDRVAAELHAVGARLTSSGGRRRLTATVSATRSATSLHYLGRAIDLHVGSGMDDPRSDPYVVTQDADRYWRVWAACESGQGRALTLAGWVHSGQRAVEVTGFFVDLTEIMARHGFSRIRRRRSYPSTYGAAEWWHHQYEGGLVAGVTRYGDELLRVYPQAELAHTPPWRYRDGLWHRDWA